MIVQLAREGNREAAAEALKILRDHHLSSWAGVTQDEMRVLASGDTAAIEEFRAERAVVEAQWEANRERYTRWSVQIALMLGRSSGLSNHHEFGSLAGAKSLVEMLISDPDNALEWLLVLDRKGYANCDASTAWLQSTTLVRQELLLPWYWINGYEVWDTVEVEQQWTSPRGEAYRKSVERKSA